MKAAAARRRLAADAEIAPDATLEAAQATLIQMPGLSSLNHIASSGSLGIIDYLNECIKAARTVMEHARMADGRVRAAKLLLFGSEHLRRCLETAHRIAESVHEMQRIDEFHAIIIEEVRRESPATARAILARIDKVSQDYGAL